MWCATCHQDVPLRHGDATAEANCTRCGAPFDDVDAASLDACAAYLSEDSSEALAQPTTAETFRPATDFDNTALEQLLAGPPLPKDDWRFEAELRVVNRLVDRLRRTTPSAQPASSSPATIPFQPLAAAPIPSAMTRMQAMATQSTHTKSAEKSSFAAWALLSLGVSTFVCGGVLLGWSFFADRGDLWSLGLPLTLAGQAGLILGLVLQLEGLWRSTRHTDQTLSDLDGQLHQLRHATTMLSTTHSSPAQSFYAHMAEGASPQLLMADLKGQIDLLAQQMAARERRSA